MLHPFAPMFAPGPGHASRPDGHVSDTDGIRFGIVEATRMPTVG